MKSCKNCKILKQRIVNLKNELLLVYMSLYSPYYKDIEINKNLQKGE